MKITRIYRMLSDDQKINFWTITTNVFLVVFTFWMGLAVQKMVANKSAEVSNRLTHYEYMEKFFPKYDAFYKQFGSLILELGQPIISNGLSDEERSMYMLKIWQNKQNEIENLADSLIILTGELKYYQPSKEVLNKFTSNNGLMIVLLDALDESNKSIKKDSAVVMNRRASYGLFLYGSPNKNMNKIDSLIKQINKLDQPTALKNVIFPYLMQPLISNLMELQKIIEVNQQEEDSLIEKYDIWLILALSILLGFLLCYIFSSIIAPKTIDRKHTDKDYSDLENKMQQLPNELNVKKT